MTIKELQELALYAAKNQAPANFSKENVQTAFLDGLNEFCGSINNFMKNRYDIYEIISKTVDEIVPKNVINSVASFAEVVQVKQNEKATFRIKNKLGRERAKAFLTQVGVSGVYETFRLDTESFTVGAHAVGGAARVDFERILDGADSMSELMEIVKEGLEEATYIEIHRALANAVKTLQNVAVSSNRVVAGAGFVGNEMAKLINIVKSYGRGAAIFATPDFITEMGPDAIIPPIMPTKEIQAGVQGIYHPEDIDAIHNTGRIKIFRGTPIVELPQAYTDETHTKTQVPNDTAYIFPTGGEKLVKVVFEGNTQVYDAKNRDNSMEINVYKKMGAAVMTRPDWCVYINTNLSEDFDKTFGGYGF